MDFCCVLSNGRTQGKPPAAPQSATPGIQRESGKFGPLRRWLPSFPSNDKHRRPSSASGPLSLRKSLTERSGPASDESQVGKLSEALVMEYLFKPGLGENLLEQWNHFDHDFRIFESPYSD